jgi:hypothetical protein
MVLAPKKVGFARASNASDACLQTVHQNDRVAKSPDIFAVLVE